MINIPISVIMKLKKSKNVLILGVGGGFDIFSGLPIYFTLEKMGINLHLANFTNSNWENMNNYADIIPMASSCVGVTGNIKQSSNNFPELFLASWFKEIKQKDVNIWAFKREQNVSEYSNSLNILVKHLSIDAILLVDGGVDSIMTGEEDGSGKMIEDTLTLAAVKNVDIPTKILACIGFGSELEDNISHYLALQNISTIIKQGGFYGTCSLVDYMSSFKDYKEACIHVFNQPNHKKNDIQTKIIPSCEGEFGDYHMYPEEKKMDVFLSPLTSMYWFFNAEAAIYNNKIIEAIEDKETFFDIVQTGVPIIKNFANRNRSHIPLT